MTGRTGRLLIPPKPDIKNRMSAFALISSALPRPSQAIDATPPQTATSLTVAANLPN